MSKHNVDAAHEKSFVNFERAYETNVIGLRGVIYFGVGLFLLVVVTFGLMYVLQNVMENQAIETKDARNPMMRDERERLPPEPRLQAAPGFGVDSEQGRVNLELRAPQSEWRTLKADWQKIWDNGQRDPKTGTVITLPLEEAKKKMLEQSAATNGDKQAGEKLMDESRQIVSFSNAGRTATDTRR